MANDKLNVRCERVLIEAVNVNDPQQIKTGKNQGKDFWRIGIKTPDGWRNTTAFSESEKDQYAGLKDMTILLSLWEEEYEGKTYQKCGFPKQIDIIDDRCRQLEEKMAGVTKFLHYYCDKNPGAAEELKNYTN